MGNEQIPTPGLQKPPQSVQESVDGIVRLIDGATRESIGGKFVLWDGTPYRA